MIEFDVKPIKLKLYKLLENIFYKNMCVLLSEDNMNWDFVLITNTLGRGLNNLFWYFVSCLLKKKEPLIRFIFYFRNCVILNAE